MQGLFFYAHIMCVLCLAVLAASAFYICRIAHSQTRYCELFFAALCPTAAYAAEAVLQLSYRLVPFGLIAGLLILIHFIYITRIDEMRETARNFTFDYFEDALIVLDSNGVCKDFNLRAAALFPELKRSECDRGLLVLSPELKSIVKQNAETEIERKGRIYKSVRRTLETSRGSGCVFWFVDVTEQRNQASLLANYQRDLETNIREKSATIQRMQIQMIINFASIVDSRDKVTGGHIKRTSRYVRMLIEALVDQDVFPELRDPVYAEHICLSAPLHDIGKIAIPDSILNKNDAYTDEEFEIMKSHTWLGGHILDKTMSTMEDRAYYWLARNMTVYHHERWDGTGYPKRLSGCDIPLCARVMAVADVFDALTSTRPYKEAITVSDALDIIRAKSGNHFDPAISMTFLSLEKKLQAPVFIK